MAIQDCLNVIKKAAGEGKISDDQAEQLLSEIDEFLTQKKKALQPDNLDATIAAHLQQRLNDSIFAAALEKRNALINAKIAAQAFNKIAAFENPAEGLSAMMVGSVKSKVGSKLSIDAQGKALMHKYIGRLINDLEKDDLLVHFSNGHMDDDIARELFEIKPNGQPGITKNPPAQKIAAIIHKYQVVAIERANRAGAYIQVRPGYMFRQTHDSAKINSTGFEAWRDFIVDKLDPEETFRGEDPNKFLEGAYLGLISGLHKRYKGETESNFLQGFKGPANLAKKMSQERILHFKDADSFMAYNDRFGTQGLHEAVLGNLEHMARNTALMEGLGTNPVAMFDRLVTQLKLKNRANQKVFNALSSKSLTNQLKEIDGTTRIPANVSLAKVGAVTRAVQNMSKLGGAFISSITDVPQQAAELRHQGEPLFKAWGDTIFNVFKGRGNAERKELARLLGVGFDGMVGEIASRFGSQDTLPGTMAKLQQRFFKLNLMSWWNDTNRTGAALTMSSNLAGKAKASWNKLDDRLINVLSQYEIGPAEWDIYRKHAVKKADDGNTYMVSEGLEDVEDIVFYEYLLANTGKEPTPKQVAQARDQLISRLDTYYMDRADYAVPQPGAAERAIMNQGSEVGTIEGEAIRLIMQFKSFPVTVIRRSLGREVYGAANGKTDIMGLAHIIATTTLFGYGSMVAKDILKGREPRQFTGDFEKDSKLMFAAMSQGGGLGIYGDFLFGEYSRYGRSFLSTLAGPTFGQVDDVAELFTRMRTGEDISANAMRMVINNTPFINLFYTRQALDYLILYELQEMANPGYLRRMESRIMRENDQRFFIPPSQQIPYGGSLGSIGQ
jgi:hypothetical protein